jgi:predicted Fe-Mo cluster-binding NifX family protein
MRIAIPVWNGRVTPVFDVARSIRVFDTCDGAVSDVSDHRLKTNARAESLIKIGVDLLICSAISAPLESTLCMSGIEVIPETCGVAEDIIGAFVAGDTKLVRFRSPGKTRNEPPSRVAGAHHQLGSRTRR